MGTETLVPNGELSDSGLSTSTHTDHDLDPDVSSVVIAATSNNTDTEYGVNFPVPTGDPTVGTDLQEFRAGVSEFDSGQSGTPTARIELWENGTLVRAGPDTNVSTYAVLSFTWNANELSTADGSLVQCKVIGTKTGGSPSTRNTVNIGHIEWNADYTAAADVLTADDVQSTSEVSAPVIGQEHVLNAADTQSTSEVSTPVIAQVQVMLATGAESTSEVTAPVIALITPLLANDAESASNVSTPVVGQIHAILTDDALSLTEVTAPVIGQTHSILVSSVDSGSELSGPIITQEHVLLAGDAESAVELTQPALAESNVLLANSIESATEVTAPVIQQSHALFADSVESMMELTAPAIGQKHGLGATSIESASELTLPVLIGGSLLLQALRQANELYRFAGLDISHATTREPSQITTTGIDCQITVITDGVRVTRQDVSQITAPAGDETTLIAGIINDLWQLAGLDKDNPMDVTTTNRTVGAIDLAITGDGVTTSTVTRQ